jgi:hypothetical protein
VIVNQPVNEHEIVRALRETSYERHPLMLVGVLKAHGFEAIQTLDLSGYSERLGEFWTPVERNRDGKWIRAHYQLYRGPMGYAFVHEILEVFGSEKKVISTIYEVSMNVRRSEAQ